MGPSKRTSCLTSSAPWLGATPFLPSNQYPSFQESWSPYGTHSCTMSEKHVYATANKETTLAPLGLYRNHAKSTGTWTFRFRTSSFETQQSTIRDCINVFLCSKKMLMDVNYNLILYRFPAMFHSWKIQQKILTLFDAEFQTHVLPTTHPLTLQTPKTWSSWTYWLRAQGMVSPARCGSFVSDPSHFALERVETLANHSTNSWLNPPSDLTEVLLDDWKHQNSWRLEKADKFNICRCKGMFQICLYLGLAY